MKKILSSLILLGFLNSTAYGVSKIQTADIAANAVTNAKLATIAPHTHKGNNTGLTAVPTDLTSAQLTAEINTFTSTLPGTVPASGGSSTNYLNGAGGWSVPAVIAPTVQRFTTTGATTGYMFTVTSANATVGARYINNGGTCLVFGTIAAKTELFCTWSGNSPAASGTLTKIAGTGDSTITFSANQGLATYTTPSPTPLYLEVEQVGAGGGGAGGGAGGGSGNDGTTTAFGTNLLITRGGKGGTSGSTSCLGGTITAGAGPLIERAFAGGLGGNQAFLGNASAMNAGGMGAPSPFGGAGSGAYQSIGSDAAANSGSGGGGGGSDNTTNMHGGQGGCAGGYYMALITSVSGSFFYTIGAKGTAGSAAASGYNGSAGGDGYLRVTEHYQ